MAAPALAGADEVEVATGAAVLIADAAGLVTGGEDWACAGRTAPNRVVNPSKTAILNRARAIDNSPPA